MLNNFYLFWLLSDSFKGCHATQLDECKSAFLKPWGNTERVFYRLKKSDSKVNYPVILKF